MSNNQGVWCSKCYGDHYTNDCPEPVASVEAKEKEQCPNCNHKAHFALRCGALIATGSGQEWDGEIFCECLNWVAESKPTPSTPDEPHKNGWHYGYITCSCGWAWDSRNTLTGSLATQHGLRIFEKHKAEVSKPQPDSSSIPDEPVNIVAAQRDRIFELEGLILFLHRQGEQDEHGDMHWNFCLSKHHHSMESALRNWRDSAAKGQSNGR